MDEKEEETKPDIVVFNPLYRLSTRRKQTLWKMLSKERGNISEQEIQENSFFPRSFSAPNTTSLRRRTASLSKMRNKKEKQSRQIHKKASTMSISKPSGSLGRSFGASPRPSTIQSLRKVSSFDKLNCSDGNDSDSILELDDSENEYRKKVIEELENAATKERFFTSLAFFKDMEGKGLEIGDVNENKRKQDKNSSEEKENENIIQSKTRKPRAGSTKDNKKKNTKQNNINNNNNNKSPSSSPTNSSINGYAEILKEKALLRKQALTELLWMEQKHTESYTMWGMIEFYFSRTSMSILEEEAYRPKLGEIFQHFKTLHKHHSTLYTILTEELEGFLKNISVSLVPYLNQLVSY